jgi:hypothetical protein
LVRSGDLRFHENGSSAASGTLRTEGVLVPSRSAILVLLLGAVGAALLYRHPFFASNFEVVPDSTEYALAAHRFVSTGDYKILVEGKWLPPRYPPWFSILVLAPAYLVFGPEPGNAIFPVTFFGVAGILLAFFLGRSLAGEGGGVGAALAVLVLPLYRFWARQVMTDVPATVLVLAAGLAYLKLRTNPNRGAGFFFLSGVLVSGAVLLRPVSLAVLLPFLGFLFFSRNLESRLQKLGLVLLPVVLVGVAHLAYNAHQFGSCFRSGYSFWAAVPYDYSKLVFSTAYVRQNATVLWESKAGLFALWVGIAGWFSSRFPDRRGNQWLNLDALRSLGEFVLWGTGPMVLFHLFYFFPQDRFYLPSVTLLGVLGGALTGGWLGWLPRYLLPGLLVLLFVGTLFLRVTAEEPPPYRRLAAEEIVKWTPEGSWILSGMEPPYLEYWVARDGERRVLPLSREVEYANKLLTPQRIPNPDPPPQDWKDHRAEGLLRGGAAEAVQWVASEQMERIREELSRGTRVFLCTVYVSSKDRPTLEELRERFVWIRRSRFLFELQPQNMPERAPNVSCSLRSRQGLGVTFASASPQGAEGNGHRPGWVELGRARGFELLEPTRLREEPGFKRAHGLVIGLDRLFYMLAQTRKVFAETKKPLIELAAYIGDKLRVLR